MSNRAVKLEAILNSLIERGGYSRNRQPILDSVGVTAAALSQYAKGHTRPSFQKLVALADFFAVSLDYLVYGEPVSSPVDPRPITRYVEQALMTARARTNQHSDLVARIGRLLMERVDKVAEELVNSTALELQSLIDLDDVVRVERYCLQADIIATDLGPNIIAWAEGDTAPGQFFQVVATNLARGCTYRFLLAGELTTQSTAIARFQEMMAATVGEDRLHEYCHFRRTVFPVMGGSGLYQLDTVAFAREEPGLFTQFDKYLLNNSWFGYLNRPNDDSNADMLMSPDYTERACGAFEALWNAAGARF